MNYTLIGAADDQREAAERAHTFHAENCPVARSISDSIEITTHLSYSA